MSSRDDEHGNPPDRFDQAHFLRHLPREDWDELLEALWKYAGREIRRHRWNGAAPTRKGLASRAVLKVLTRPSMWNPAKRRRRLPPKKCLRKFLFDLIQKDARGLWDRHANQFGVDHETDDGRSLLDDAEDRTHSPEEDSEAGDMRSLIRRIESFCDRRGYGELFRLYYFLELKPAEIGKILGLTAKRVSSLVAQMKDLIRRHFGPEGETFLGPA